MNIIAIDMQIRDERVFQWLCKKAGDSAVQVAADDVAGEFKCHANTARAILKRLQQAGLIAIEQRSFRGGFSYKVTREVSQR